MDWICTQTAKISLLLLPYIRGWHDTHRTVTCTWIVLSSNAVSLHLQDLHDWTTLNNMKINYAKTKEMILGPVAKCPSDLLSHSSTDQASIERVKCFKLLGIYLSDALNWQAHVNVITSKSATRLYFLIILKKSGLNPHHLLHFYLSVIRPELEYCSV